jgi:hypothetical protein
MFGRGFWITAIAAAATLSFAGSAFTNSVTAPALTSNAGGVAVIGEFSVDTANVTYTLDTTDPRNVTQVVFTILAPGTTPTFVRIRPVSTGSWYTCTLAPSGPNQIATCATTSPQWTLVTGLTNMTSLSIVIRD